MSFPILQDYQQRFPQLATLLTTLPTLYNKKYPRIHPDSGTNSPSPCSSSSTTPP